MSCVATTDRRRHQVLNCAAKTNAKIAKKVRELTQIKASKIAVSHNLIAMIRLQVIREHCTERVNGEDQLDKAKLREYFRLPADCSDQKLFDAVGYFGYFDLYEKANALENFFEFTVYFREQKKAYPSQSLTTAWPYFKGSVRELMDVMQLVLTSKRELCALSLELKGKCDSNKFMEAIVAPLHEFLTEKRYFEDGCPFSRLAISFGENGVPDCLTRAAPQ